MSIYNLLQECTRNGDLHRVQVLNPYAKSVRVIYVTEPIKAFIDGPETRAGFLQADLDRFIEGGLITASMIPRKAGVANMGLLKPPEDGIWDIRSQDPKPSLRLFGGFVRKDVFVGLVMKERKLLGDFLSRPWANAVTECNREWQKRFLAYKPFTGDSVHDYLSNCRCVDSAS